MLEIYLRAVPFTSMHLYSSAAIFELGVADIQNDVTRSFDFNGWSFESRACHVNLVPAAQHLEWRVAFSGFGEIPVGIDLNLFQLNVRGDVDQLETLTLQVKGWVWSQKAEVCALFHESATVQMTALNLEGQCGIPKHQPAPPCTCITFRWILDSINLQLCQCLLFRISFWRFHTAIHKCEVRHCGLTTWSLVFKDLNFSLKMATLPGTDWRLATEKCQSPTLSATLTLGPTANAFHHPFPRVALALWVQAPTCWKSLDSSQWYLSIFWHWRTWFLTDWTWYRCLRSIRRCHSYPHLQSWGWSPARRAPSWWLSKTVERLPSRSIAARSIVPLGIGCLVYETWQEFVSRRNDCSRWNRTLWKNAKNMLFLHVPGERPLGF